MKTKHPDPIVGQRFGKLVCVETRTTKATNGNWKYKYRCDCGGTTNASKHEIYNKGYKSCGCIRKDDMRGLPGEVSFTGVFDSCKQSAKLRDMLFTLTKLQHKAIVVQNCHYCGEPPKPYNFYVKSDGSKRNSKKAIRQSSIDLSWISVNGVDRVDSKIGYIIENCVPCCSDCNRAKWEMSQGKFIEHSRKIVTFQDSKKNAA